MPTMAKKKRPTEPTAPPEGGKQQKKKPDQHASGFMVRLPEVYREQLLKLREQTRRTMTAEVQVALEEYLKKHNLWPPAGE